MCERMSSGPPGQPIHNSRSRGKRKQRNLSQEFKALFFFCERRPGIEFRNHLASVPCFAVAIVLTGCLPDDIRTDGTHWSNAAIKGMRVEGPGRLENIHEVFVVKNDAALYYLFFSSLRLDLTSNTKLSCLKRTGYSKVNQL